MEPKTGKAKLKEFLSLLLLLTLAISIPVVVFSLHRQIMELRKRAMVPVGPATLMLIPDGSGEGEVYRPEEEFDVDIKLNTGTLEEGGGNVYMFTAVLDFSEDQNKIEVVETPEGDAVLTPTDTEFTQKFENSIAGGIIRYKYSYNLIGGSPMPFTGVMTIGTVRFKVKDVPSGIASVQFADESRVMQRGVGDYDPGVDILGTIRGGTYTVQAPRAPTATITAPSDGEKFLAGEEITFAGEANDEEDGPLSGASLVWTSSIDGEIGTGENFTRDDLSVGEHTVTLTATDSDEQTGTDSITIKVVQLDHVSITPDSATVQVGKTQDFAAHAYDADDEALILNYDDFIWSVEGGIGSINYADQQLTDGSSRAVFAAETVGSGVVKATATVSGITKEGSASVTVTEQPQPLTCGITLEGAEFTIQPDTEMPLSIVASGGTSNYSYVWSAGKGSFHYLSPHSVLWTSPQASEVEDGEEIMITATVDDGEDTCSDSVTAIIVEPTATLNFVFQLEMRTHLRTDTMRIFARETGSGIGYDGALWKQEIQVDTTAAGNGSTSGLSLAGLDTEKGYDFLLRSTQHLQKKVVISSLESENTLDFGVLQAGDLNANQFIGGDDISIWVHEIEGEEKEEYQSDINADGILNGADVSIIIHNLWLEGDQ